MFFFPGQSYQNLKVQHIHLPANQFVWAVSEGCKCVLLCAVDITGGNLTFLYKKHLAYHIPGRILFMKMEYISQLTIRTLFIFQTELRQLSVFVVDSRYLLSLLVHHHRAFGLSIGHHSSERCLRWLCEFITQFKLPLLTCSRWCIVNHFHQLTRLWIAVCLCTTWFQFRHKNDQQVNNRQSQVLIKGRLV